jgi:hypothetical protein
VRTTCLVLRRFDRTIGDGCRRLVDRHDYHPAYCRVHTLEWLSGSLAAGWSKEGILLPYGFSLQGTPAVNDLVGAENRERRLFFNGAVNNPPSIHAPFWRGLLVQEKVSMARSPGTNQMATDTTHCTTPAASIAAPTLDDWLEALLEGVVVPVLLAHTRARYFFWNNNVDRMSGWPSVPVPALPSKTGSQRPILSCRAKQAAASFSSEYACRRRQKRTKVVAVVPSLDSWSKIVDKGIWASTTRVAALHNEGRHNMEGDRCQSIRTFLPNVFHPHFHPGSGPSANRRRRIVGNRSSLSEWPTQVGRGDLPAWIIAGSHIFTNQ